MSLEHDTRIQRSGASEVGTRRTVRSDTERHLERNL